MYVRGKMVDKSTTDKAILIPSSVPVNRKRHGLLVVIGGILIHLTFGTTYTFGKCMNMFSDLCVKKMSVCYILYLKC